MKALFIFHNDLRIQDNTTLNLLSEYSILPVFILDNRQIINNPYSSDYCLRFMQESLDDLNSNLRKSNSKLHVFKGLTHEIVANLIKKFKPQIVASNKDYSPFAIKRDKQIEKVCKQNEVEFISEHDRPLTPFYEIKTGSKTDYRKFTPYYNNAVKKINSKITNRRLKFTNIKSKNEKLNLDANVKHQRQKGGRKEGLKLLSKAAKMKNYKNTSNYLSKKTTMLSAHNKFGTISIREVYAKVKSNAALVQQLIWRDFYFNIMLNNDVILKNFRKPNPRIVWKNDKTQFKKWKEGKTGYPLVDAGMREMNKTGFMHNRARMIVASFLVKKLKIDWRKGEKYFAQNLIDYDISQNNGNWQWCAGTGVDSRDRTFNPNLQSKKYDADCEYIYTWIPELQDVPAKDIHNWPTKYKNYSVYYEPIL